MAGGNGISGSKINHTAADPALQTYLNRINEIIVLNTVNSNFNEVEPLSAGLIPVTSSNISSSTILADGSNTVKRKLMAKILVNAYYYKTLALLKTAPNISNYTIIGDKFELMSNPSGNLPVTVSGGITMASGETRDIGPNIDMQDGNPLYYYWTVDEGTLTSLYPNHKMVRFTAPTVSSSTDYNMYYLSGTSDGEISEAFITITVTPPTGPMPPTVQSSNINFTNVTYSSISFNWNRGNGAYCLVTLTPQGSTVDNPSDGTVYTGNTNFSSAPAIINGSNTKVIYAGTGNSLTVTGLQANTYYLVDIYEYNAITPPESKYLVPGHLTSTFHIPQIPTTTVDFTWDPNPIIAGQACTFYSQGSNYTNCHWTFTGANITTSDSIYVPGVVYSTAGTYNVTLTNYNSNTGQSVPITKAVTVVSTNYLLPDLLLGNVTANQTNIIENQNITISGNELNVGNSYYSGTPNNIKFYLSKNNVYDGSDTYFGLSTDFYIANAVPANGSIPFTKTLTVLNNMAAYIGPGDYYILCEADGGISVDESNETNNFYALPINISAALPDFVTLSLSTSLPTIAAGQTFTATGIFENIGPGNSQNGSAIVSLFLSNDSILSIDDLDIGYVININNGNISFPNHPVTASNSNVRIPSYIPAGNYYLIAAIDFSFYGHGYAWDMNYEVSETNNSKAVPITVSNPNQPTIPSSNLQLTNITNNSVTLSWTNGNGQGRIAIVSDGYPAFPSDGNTYTANSDYSQGTQFGNCGTEKVVYNGTGNSVTVTGLTTGSDYYFSVFEYNGSGSSIDYLQKDGIGSGSCPFSRTGIFAKINSTPQYNNGWAVITDVYSYQFEYGSNSLYFNNNQSGYAAGVNGELFKTTDGGITWKYRYFDFITKAIYFSGNNGWIGGTSGNLYKSTDDGNTWNRQTINTSFTITGLYFINSNLGFCVTSDASNVNGEIYKTINGGANWNKLTDVSNSLSSVYFINSSIGWVSGNSVTILKTIDGGQNWVSEISGCGFGVIKSLCFINADTGFAVNYWTSNVIRTNDGGNTWSQININGTTKYGVVFLNKLIGFVYGYHEINKTIDGGQTWTTYPLSFDPSSLCCIDENNLFACYQGVYKTITGSQLQFINKPVINNTYCVPATFNLNYTIAGTFNSGNIFKAEISDANGSFANPVTIGQLAGINNGTINCNIPIGLTNGTNYKIRISATNPATTGAESDAFSINQTPVANINGLQSSYLTTSPNIALANCGSPSGGIFTINGIPSTIFSPSILGQGSYTINYSYTAYGNYTFTSIPAAGTYCACPTNNINSLTCNTSNMDLYSGNLLQLMLYSIDPYGNMIFRIKKNTGMQFTSPGTFEIRDTITGSCWTTNVNSGQTNADININYGTFIGVRQFIGIFRSSLGSKYYAGIVSVTGTGQNMLCSNQISKTVTVSIPNAISTTNISPTSYCAGNAINVTYTVQGNYNAGNQFYVELSNSSGSFTNPIVINSVASVNSGTIACFLPVSSVHGTSYKVRVSSTDPVVTGAVSNTFTINAANIPSVNVAVSDTEVCAGTPVIFTATPVNGGSPVYQWQVNGANAGINNPVFTTSTLQNGDIVQVQMTSNISCAYPASVLSNQVSVIVNDIVTPTAYIESDNSSVCNGGVVNIWSYVDNEGTNPLYQWSLNGINLSVIDPFFSIDTLTHAANIILHLTSNANCASVDTATSNLLHIDYGVLPPTPVISVSNDTLFSNAIVGNQWYDQNGLISGATDNYYVPTSSGNYYAIVDNGNCFSDTSNIIPFVFTGIQSIPISSVISIYPNPAIDKIIITSNPLDKSNIISIYNIHGQLLIRKTIQQAKTEINISIFSKGLYFIRVENEDGVAVKKFIKE